MYHHPSSSTDISTFHDISNSTSSQPQNHSYSLTASDNDLSITPQVQPKSYHNLPAGTHLHHLSVDSPLHTLSTDIPLHTSSHPSPSSNIIPPTNPIQINGSPLSIESSGSLPSPNLNDQNNFHNTTPLYINDNNTNNLHLRKYTRSSNPHSYLAEYNYFLIRDSSNNPPLSPTTQPSYPLSSIISYDKYSSSYNIFYYAISSISKPNTYKQAIKYECWIKAMDVELKALAKNHTWVVVDLPPGKVPIGCCWV